MGILIDTNLIIRCSDPRDPDYQTAVDALDRLDKQGHQLRLVPQNFYEYWAVASRPKEQNGLGFSPASLQQHLEGFNKLFPVLRDERRVLDHWQRLVIRHEVKGRQVHDARLVAAMERHGLTHILTFDTDDFKRYRHITVIDPADV